MLHAFNAHKISEDIRNELWNLEDVKTSSIIGTLSHLPAQLFWNLLYKAVQTEHRLPPTVTELRQIEFWPSWKMENRVEPDVFIRFKEFDLIIELKRNDENRQTLHQWKKEMEAYQLRYGNDHQPVYLIAISGRTEEAHEGVIQSSWSSLLEAVWVSYHQYKSEKPYSHEVRILKDALTAFNIHHEYQYRYLNSIVYHPETDHINEHTLLFSNL